MADIDAILVDNLKECLRQTNRYLNAGFFSSLIVFALAVDPAAFAGASGISIPSLTTLPLKHAQIALVGVYWLSPFMAYFTVSRAHRIAIELQKRDRQLVSAASTFPCILTSRVHGPRILICLLPPLLVSIAGWTTGVFNFSFLGLFLFLQSLIPHVSLYIDRLRRSFGELAPDAFGD